MIIIDTCSVMKMVRALCIAATLCLSASIFAAEKAVSPEKGLYFRGILLDGRLLTQGVEKINVSKMPEASVFPRIVLQDTMDYSVSDFIGSMPSKGFETMLQENITHQIDSRGPFAVKLAWKQKAPQGRIALLISGLLALEKTKYDSKREDRLKEDRLPKRRPTSGGCTIS